MLRKYESISVILLILIAILALSPVSWTHAQTTLIHKDVYNNDGFVIPKLTKTVATEELGGKLFSRPYSASISYTYHSYETVHALMFIVDPYWNRIIYADREEDWINSYGTYGSGEGNLKSPYGITSNNDIDGDGLYDLYVADTYNNRIVHLIYYSYYQYRPIYQAGLIGGPDADLDLPRDVDLNDNSNLDNADDDYLWVVDFGHHMIKRFTKDGTLVKSFGGYGTGEDQFKRPVGIVNGRDLQGGYNNKYLYVVDSGNNRIVKLYNPNPTEVDWVGCYEAPSGSYLTSIEVDTFGDLWVTDTYNGRVIKLTPDLELLTVFGTEGTGTNQFLYPTALSNPRAFAYFDGWIGWADAFIAEKWSSNSGGQYYNMGVDVLDLQVETNSDHTMAYCYFTLTDKAKVTVNVYKYDGNCELPADPIQHLCWREEMNAGFIGPIAWDATGEFGKYLIGVCATSLYLNSDGHPLNQICKVEDVWVGEYSPNTVSLGIKSESGPCGKDCTCYTKYPKLTWCLGTLPLPVQYPATHLYYDIYRKENDSEWEIQTRVNAGEDFANYDDIECSTPEYKVIGPLPSNGSRVYYYIESHIDFCGEHIWFSSETLSVQQDEWHRMDCPSPPPCPTLFFWNGRRHTKFNNILPESEQPENEGRDIPGGCHLQVDANCISSVFGQIKLMLRETAEDHSFFDQFKLVSVFHPRDVNVAVSKEGEIIGFRELLPPYSVKGTTGEKLSHLLTEDDSLVFEGITGDSLLVDFGEVDGDAQVYVIIGGKIAEGERTNTKTIDKPEPVLAMDPPGSSTKSKLKVGISYRINRYTELLPLPNTFVSKDSLRFILYWQIPYEINFIGMVREESVPFVITENPLKSATHTSQGDITKNLTQRDGSYAELSGDEQIELIFSPVELPQTEDMDKWDKDFILLTYGHYLDESKVTGLEGKSDDTPLPMEYSLSQNFLNPFNPTTEIGYALPRDAQVRLEIYNLLGQKVATLVEGKQKAGYKVARWDAGSFSSGIYFYRLRAGDFVQARKMVLLR